MFVMSPPSLFPLPKRIIHCLIELTPLVHCWQKCIVYHSHWFQFWLIVWWGTGNKNTIRLKYGNSIVLFTPLSSWNHVKTDTEKCARQILHFSGNQLYSYLRIAYLFSIYSTLRLIASPATERITEISQKFDPLTHPNVVGIAWGAPANTAVDDRVWWFRLYQFNCCFQSRMWGKVYHVTPSLSVEILNIVSPQAASFVFNLSIRTPWPLDYYIT